MSIYNFLPNRPRKESVVPFVTMPDLFTNEELDKIVELCETFETETAKVGDGVNGEVSPNIRRTKISWLKNNPESNWIYDRVAMAARSLNSQFYRFNLFGFIEDMQYTVYQDDDEGHYTWHIDIGPNNECTRKLSLVIQLSDPSDYEGGDLEIMTSPNPDKVIKQRGLVAAFPSFILHRVTPVTKGIRRTLVVWVAGPDFV
jgi:PKHD-type hydroxylase